MVKERLLVMVDVHHNHLLAQSLFFFQMHPTAKGTMLIQKVAVTGYDVKTGIHIHVSDVEGVIKITLV